MESMIAASQRILLGEKKMGGNCTDLNYMIEMMEQLESRIFHSITKIGRGP